MDHVKIFSVNTPGRTSLLLCRPSVILIGCGSAKSKELVNRIFQYLDYILVMARCYFWTSVVVCIWTLGTSIMDSHEGAGLNLQVQKRRTLNYNLRPLKGDIMCIFSLIQRSYFIYHLLMNKWKLKKTYLESALVVISLMFFFHHQVVDSYNSSKKKKKYKPWIDIKPLPQVLLVTSCLILISKKNVTQVLCSLWHVKKQFSFVSTYAKFLIAIDKIY